MKLKHLIEKNVSEANLTNFEIDIGDLQWFLRDVGLSELRINMMKTHSGEPFISFSLSDNEAVGKLSRFINGEEK